MAVSPYDQAAWSTYTPLSSQEILQPALMMRERHDRLDEEYAAIDDELQKIAFIAETENDPAVQQMYNNYTTQLESGMNELMERGVTPNSRRRMLGVRSRFQSQIAPIRQAYELKQQDINQINQMRMKDPTFIGPDPTQRSLTDYLANGLQPMGHQGISGALLTQMANQYLAPYSQELTDTEFEDLLLTTVGEEKIPQYKEYIKKHGYKPGIERHRVLMEAVSNKIMESTGIREWANEDQLKQAQGYINMAETATIGKDQSQVLNDNAFGLAVQRQAAKDMAAENNGSPKGLQWHANTRTASVLDVEFDRTMLEDIDKINTGETTSVDTARERFLGRIHMGLSSMNPGVSKETRDKEKESTRKILKDYEAGNITETELRKRLHSNMISEKDINDYFKKVNNTTIPQFKEWQKQNPNGTLDDFKAIVHDDVVSKRVIGHTSYKPLNTAVNDYFSNKGDNYLNNINNRSDVVVRNTNSGKTKNINDLDIAEVKKAINNGISFYNPDVGGPSFDYIYDEKGKGNKTKNSYNISIPMTSLDIDSKILEPYTRVMKVIQSPYSNNKTITFISPLTGNPKEYNIIKKMGGDYYLQSGKEVVSLTEILEEAVRGIESGIISGSVPHSKLR